MTQTRLVKKATPFLSRDNEREIHITQLFADINEWFFGNDTTNFDPTTLEILEEKWTARGALNDREYAALKEIYENRVCN